MMLFQMFHDITYFLRLIRFADHQNITSIHNNHVIQADCHNEALIVTAVNKRIMRIERQVLRA